MKNILLLLALGATSVFADYKMAMAKATREIHFNAPVAHVNYMMGGKLKEVFEKNLPLELNKKSIQMGQGKEMTIVPAQLGAYEVITNNKILLPQGRALDQIANFTRVENNSSGVNVGALAQNFATGFSAYGAEGAFTSFGDAMGNAAKNGLATLGFGLLFSGLDYLTTMSDQYVMATDVYFADERTRIIAFVYSLSINEEEALEKLSLLTSQKIAQLAAGGTNEK